MLEIGFIDASGHCFGEKTVNEDRQEVRRAWDERTGKTTLETSGEDLFGWVIFRLRCSI